jgi:hypothetical protein
MNQKLLMLVAGLLVGGVAVYLVSKPNSAARMAEPDVVTAPEAGYDSSGDTRVTATPVRMIVTPPAPAAPVSAWARLAEKYGPEKTALASKITTDITGMINDGVELARVVARNSGSSNLTEAATKELLRGATRELALTPEQQAQASGFIRQAVEHRVVAVNDLLQAMSSEPEQIMELLLAGDALARQQISPEDYNMMTLATRTMLQQVGGFVTGRPLDGSAQTLIDPVVAAQLNAILTPEQQDKFAQLTATMAERALAREAAQARSGFPFKVGEIPVMELERLDQSVGSVRQMTEAARLMMDAMKGLKDANARTGTP